MTLQAPFPWFGGKSRVADVIWERLGAVNNYVEPFFGSGAVLLSRPDVRGTETINDKDRFVANFWRAVSADPDAVARWVDWPVNEVDLTARHLWLLDEGARLIERCDGDPDYFDAKVAGWWCWGACSWIGSGWCSGNGPWTWDRAALGWKKRNAGLGVNRKGAVLAEWMTRLSDRLHSVRVCAGDWARVCGDSVTWRHGTTGVFLDPPYADTAGRTANIYAQDSLTVAHDAREWAITAGRNPLMRIAFAGYRGEHTFPRDWSEHRWKSVGGFGGQGDKAGRENAGRETIWFSPHCIPPNQGGLFDMAPAEDPAEARVRDAFAEPERGA